MESIENDTRKWCYSGSEEGAYHGGFDMREKCIEDARACYDGEAFYIGRVTPIDVADHPPHCLGMSAIESVTESIGELIGEAVEEWEESLAVHEAALDDVIELAVVNYIKEHCPPTCFSVEGVEFIAALKGGA